MAPSNTSSYSVTVTDSDGSTFDDSIIITVEQAFGNLQPYIEWQRTFEHSEDFSYGKKATIKQTTDGGYIVAVAEFGNIVEITKLLTNGELEWQKTFGEYSGFTGWEINHPSIEQTIDGGYIVAASTYSSDGTITDIDVLIVKLYSNGDTQWQKTLGGSNVDYTNSIIQTIDGGYIVAGSTISNDFDIIDGNNGEFDWWIIKLSASGEEEWQKTLGGSWSDIAYSIIKTFDDGYIVVGSTSSNDFDVTDGNNSNNNFYGSSDWWIVKLSANGEQEWQKTYGGSNDEIAYSIVQSADGGFIIAGTTSSCDGDVTDNSEGTGYWVDVETPVLFHDWWIMKISNNGSEQWQKTFGGNGEDELYSIIQTDDGGYVAAGFTISSDGDIIDGNEGFNCGCPGFSWAGFECQCADFWVIKLTDDGNQEWQKTYGGTHSDIAYDIANTNDGGYIVAGMTYSNDLDVENLFYPESALWILKLTPESIIGTAIFSSDTDNTICEGQNITLTASGGKSYIWSDNENNILGTNDSITVYPINTTTYLATITKESGCTYIESITVNVNSIGVITATPTQPTCGLNNGSISVTPAGSTYSWTGGLSGSNPTGVAPGTYTVTVTGAGGCTSSTSTTLNASTGITALATPTQPTCGLNNGSISVIPVGGTYAWTGGLSGSNPTGVAPGTYTVTVTGVGGCTSSATVTLNNSSGITAVATPTQPTCGLNNGSILVTPAGGTYAWTGGLTGSNPTNVAPGTYTVTVTGAGGCTSSASVTLNTSAPSPTISLGTVQPICQSSTSFSLPYTNTTGSPDQFSLSAAGAQPMPGFVPIVNTLLTLSPLTIPVPTGVLAGTYQFNLTVRNTATGCVSAPVAVNLTINPQIQPTLAPISQLCSLAAPVSLNPVQSGITGIWSGTGISGNQFNPSGLAGNIVLFFIPTGGQCAIGDSMMVTVSAPATFNMEQTLPAVICSNDDPIALNTTQYVIAGNWSGIGVLNNEFHPALAAFGTATLTFTPLPGECALPGSIAVSVTYNLAESTLPSGFSLCADELQFLNDLSGGLAGTWSGEGVFGNLFFSDLLQPGSYPITFTYSGATQCNTATLNAQVIAPIDTLNSSIICNGADYNINFIIQGGMPPYSAYGAPLPGNTYSSYNQTGITNIAITDAMGCELPLQFSSLDCTNVAANPCNILATAQFIGSQDNSGYECEVGIAISVLSGPTGLYEYSLDGINFQAENKFWLDTSMLQQAYTPITAFVRHANCGTHAIDTLNVPAPPLSGCRLYIGPDLWAEIIDDYNQYRFVLEWMDGSYEPSIQTYEGEPVSVLVTDTLTFCAKLFTSKAPLLPRQTGVFYPNPNHGGLFYYTLPETLLNHPIRAEVFNVAGQLVADVTPQPDADHTFTIDLRLHGEGMFIIRLQIGNWVEVHKVVVWV